MNKCGYCNSGESMIEDNGDYVCRECGYVAEEKVAVMDSPAYLNEANGNDGRQHQSTTIMRHDMGVSTTMAFGHVDHAGKKISGASKRMVDRMQEQHKRNAMECGSERRLAARLLEINRIGEELDLPKMVVEGGALLCHKEVKIGGISKGNTVGSVAATCMYMVCRMNGIPRNIKEFAEAAGCKPKIIMRLCEILVDRLDLKLDVPDLMACVNRVANDAGVSERVKRDAMKMVEEAERRGVCSGRSPVGLAAGAIYLAVRKWSEKGINQRDVALASGVTDVTVRNACRVLKKE